MQEKIKLKFVKNKIEIYYKVCNNKRRAKLTTKT